MRRTSVMKVAIDNEDAHLNALVPVLVAHVNGVIFETLTFLRVVVAFDFGHERRLSGLILTQNHDALTFWQLSRRLGLNCKQN